MKKKIKLNKNTRILVVAGGWSSEREISLKSGKAVFSALKNLQFPVRFLVLNKPEDIFRIKNCDFVFLALHGSPGEDGTIQGYLEMLGIPYSGSGVLASALAMNKVAAKRIFLSCGIPTPEFFVLKEKIVQPPFSFPVVVKPVSEGSAIGVTIAENQKEFVRGYHLAKKYGDVLVEKYIRGKELTVGIVGQTILPVIEIVPNKQKFYNFIAKYQPGGSEHIIPARISPQIEKQAKKFSFQAFQALNCRGMARVDLIATEKKVYVLEVNTIPGMTATSLLPDACRAYGWKMEEMLVQIIQASL